MTWLWRLLTLLWVLSSVAQSQPLPDIEQAIGVSTNKTRQQVNTASVFLDPVLSLVARNHSEEMLSQGYFGHTSPSEMCRTLKDRLKQSNRFCLSSAENLHKCVGYPRASLADLAISSWMESPSHRKNILNGHFNRMGIGIANQGETYIFTQILSYEPVIVQSLEVVLEPGGYRVRLSALVTDGPKEGGLFLDGKRQLNWEAGVDGMFSAELLLPKAGLLEIGQLVGVREWTIETEIPIPPPGVALPRQGLLPTWLAFAQRLWADRVAGGLGGVVEWEEPVASRHAWRTKEKSTPCEVPSNMEEPEYLR